MEYIALSVPLNCPRTMLQFVLIACCLLSSRSACNGIEKSTLSINERSEFVLGGSVC